MEQWRGSKREGERENEMRERREKGDKREANTQCKRTFNINNTGYSYTCQKVSCYYNVAIMHYECTYISTLDMARSSFALRSCEHTLMSMGSMVGGISLLNHGGLLNEQQVLLAPHPSPSQSGEPPKNRPRSVSRNRLEMPESQK